MAKVTFADTQATISVAIGTEFLDLYKRNPMLPLRFGCTQGTCGVCAIEVLSGEDQLCKLTRQERATLQEHHLPAGPVRLACQCAVIGENELIVRSLHR